MYAFPNDVYNNLKRITKGQDFIIKKSQAIWLLDFQKVERKLLVDKKIEKVWIEGELCYRVL